MIEVKGVSKSYNGHTVIDHIDLQIPKGQLTSFIGPNGAGKSTLLSMISRLTSKDAGEIQIDGQELSTYKSNSLAKKISILKQTNHLNLRLTVRDLVSFGRFPYSQGRLTKVDEEAISQAIQYMGLQKLEHRFLDQLSGGQRQCAFVAMVIAQDTEYVLLDEPLNNLDMKHSVQIMKILRQLVDDLNKTIVIVLHDINFASCYSDQMVALKEGRIAHVGTAAETMKTSILSQLFELDMQIHQIDEQKISVYF